jgi:hypothetical protein
VPQKKQTSARQKIAFALTPFLRIVRGLRTDIVLNDLPAGLIMILFMSKNDILF